MSCDYRCGFLIAVCLFDADLQKVLDLLDIISGANREIIESKQMYPKILADVTSMITDLRTHIDAIEL